MYLNFCAIGLVNAQLFDQSFGLSRRLQVSYVVYAAMTSYSSLGNPLNH